MENDEYKPSRHYTVAIYIVIGAIIFFFYMYNDKFHLVKESKNNTYINSDVGVTGASLEVGENNNNLSMSSDVGIIHAYIKNTKNSDSLIVVTETKEIEIDIYTMKNHDLDLGLPLKNKVEYPRIDINTVSKLTTGGLIVETVQTLGTDTYANRVYIKDDTIIDQGFEIRTGIKDNTLYYDNVILIIDTLNKNTKDIIRIHDDATGDIIYSLSDEEAPILNDPKFGLLCSAVGNNFISLSNLYTKIGGEYFIDFVNNPTEVKSVWDYVESDKEQLQKLLAYEKATTGNCLIFQRRANNNELMYTIDYPVEIDINDVVTVPLGSK